MFKDREKLYQAYHTMLSIALTWALTLGINQYYELRVHIIMCAFYSLVPGILIYFFDMNRKNTVSYLLLFSLIPIVALIFWLKQVNPIDWINELIGWCTQYNGSKELYEASYAIFIVFAVACVGAVLFYLLTKNQIEKISLAIIIMATLIILSISKIDNSKAVIAICIFYILTIVVEVLGIIYTRKAGKQDKKEGILYLAPVCLLLAVLAVSFPSRPDPIQWKGFKHIYHNIQDKVEVLKTDLDYYFGKRKSEFSVNLTGYSEDSGELGDGGKLKKDNKIALKVTGEMGSNPIYLIGSISDVYSGRSWGKSKLDYIPGEEEYLLDYSELIYALTRQDLKVLESERFIERGDLTAEFSKIKTKTFFYPIKSSWLEVITKRAKIITEHANITFSKARGKGTTYQYAFYEMNLQGDAFQQMLRDSDSFSYENNSSLNYDTFEWLQLNTVKYDNADTILSKPNFHEILRNRAEMIQTQYTGLPDTLPDRVRVLANEITANYETTFDKLKALEGFLQEYKYTLHPGEVPKGEDFADYFLFENREGYCTSFATAMAILGRCLDIPTRYVEGFVVTFQQKDDNNQYLVKNSQSHAWAEAYIEGVGWIPFEATSPYRSSRYTEWKEPQKGNETVDSSGYSNQYDQQSLYDRMETNQQQGEAVLIPEEVEEDNTNELLTGIIIFLAAALMILLFLSIYYMILRYRYQKAFEKADYSKKMYLLFLRILGLLKLEGFVLGQQETIRMLAQRVNDKFSYDQGAFCEVATIYMQYRYAEAEVTREELNLVALYHLGLANKQKKEKSKLLVWLEDFVFLAKKSNR